MGALDAFRLDGRTAVVTGAGSGLGRGFAHALASAGADVVLGGRLLDRLQAVAEEIEATGRRAIVRRTDVTDPEDCRALAAAAMQGFGRLDVLVNNAGVGTAVPALREAPDAFRAVVDVNLFGLYWMAQAAAAVMGPGSSIVNVSSVLGLIPSRFPQAAYAASKAAVLALTRDLSNQWAGRRGIRVNAVAPGYFATEMTAAAKREAIDAFVADRSPLGRLGEQHELDAAVLFLASPAASYITGSTLAVDGGMSGH